MGRRGPRPATKEHLSLHGSWRAKTRRAPKPSAERPECPDWLKGEARKEWRRQVRILDAKHLLSRDYQASLVMYCQAWGEFVECTQELQRIGARTTTTDKGNLIQHPLIGVRNKACDRVMRLGREFGFTPQSELSIPTGVKDGAAVVARKR